MMLLLIDSVSAPAHPEEDDEPTESEKEIADLAKTLGVTSEQLQDFSDELGYETPQEAAEAVLLGDIEGPPTAEEQAAAQAEAAVAAAATRGSWSYNDPSSWIKGYEDYDALAGWLLGDKAVDIQKRQDELRDKFCEGMGVIGKVLVKDCAIAQMCESELYDFKDIDGVVVGRTASGEFISVMHAEGWRTTGAVFINETTSEVFPGTQRYLYKATWYVNMAKLAVPGAGAITQVANPVNGYNVLFKENGVVKYRYYDDWYMLNASESQGLTNANPFLTYSNNLYDEICLWLQTPIDVSLGIGLDSKSYQYICNDIVEHTGDPTQMLMVGAATGTPPPGVSGGF